MADAYDIEAFRIMEDGERAASQGKPCYGAGGYNPSDGNRADLWLTGYAKINPNHTDMPSQYRTDGKEGTMERRRRGLRD